MTLWTKIVIALVIFVVSAVATYLINGLLDKDKDKNKDEQN